MKYLFRRQLSFVEFPLTRLFILMFMLVIIMSVIMPLSENQVNELEEIYKNTNDEYYKMKIDDVLLKNSFFRIL